MYDSTNLTSARIMNTFNAAMEQMFIENAKDSIIDVKTKALRDSFATLAREASMGNLISMMPVMRDTIEVSEVMHNRFNKALKKFCTDAAECRSPDQKDK
mgnify:FL=1|jgi:hypothetical protein